MTVARQIGVKEMKMGTFKARCIDNLGVSSELTLNKIYTVSSHGLTSHTVNISGKSGWFYAARFVKVEDESETIQRIVIAESLTQYAAELLETALIRKFGNHFLLVKEDNELCSLLLKNGSGTLRSLAEVFSEGFLVALP